MPSPDNNAMTVETANRAYNALVAHAGATEAAREDFVYHQTREWMSEYRFGGALGSGGKFWRNSGFRPNGEWGEIWYVNAYSEDMTPRRRNVIARTDAALLKALAAHEA